MNRKTTFIALSVLITLPCLAMAQVANEATANNIIAARQKNAALMKQYSWQCRSEVIENGKTEDTRLESVTYGADGNLQRTLANDQAAPLPRGFFRKHLAEKKRAEMEKYLKGVRELLDKYTLPSAGAVINFISSASITPMKSPTGAAVIQLSGNNVVNPGDTFTLTIDPATNQTRRVVITTTYDGHSVSADATFKTLKSGLTFMQFAQIEVPDKNLSIQIHDFDYVSND